MDILRKELNEIYREQNLELESLDNAIVHECGMVIRNTADTLNGCLVITDVQADKCYIAAGSLAPLMGWSDNSGLWTDLDSSDEDFIYGALHPEDLPDKRLLEYEFLKRMSSLDGDDKLHYSASCSIRIKDRNGMYLWIDNTTRIMKLSPEGKIWLILCSYDLSKSQHDRKGITPAITNLYTGETDSLNFQERKARLLTSREKEILSMIREGKSSKMIADRLQISVNTVNRHRQNIIEKLDVANSYEAITAAVSMQLI